MTPTLARHHLPHAGATARVDRRERARDWAEIQERMLVPLYEAVYERLEVNSETRLLGLGCGAGLALLMAAARGASVTGVDHGADERLALARERLEPGPWGTRTRGDARIVDGSVRTAATAPGAPAYNLVTAFEPVAGAAGTEVDLEEQLTAAVPLAEHGAFVVLAGWGPPERCSASSVLRVAAKLADPQGDGGRWRPSRRDDLEETAQHCGLRPDGSGRVACPFGYADPGSAVRGMLSTGLFDAAIGATEPAQVDKELAEALHPYRRPDGTVWMPNVFRYLVARIP
ncbi:SAM-dependent methyltransferase [Streptomyces sp. NPDC003631]|uniref:SAM-dependent methyltransferase n=1 Tax=Streptomyces TaxID=1883 RepID=UPI002EACA08E|nr:SAM-dependent methyltransferase [Streptomyces sp. WAC07094]